MRIILLILLLLAMAAVVYVLARGVMGMASGRDLTGEQSQKWMQRRVLFQAAAENFRPGLVPDVLVFRPATHSKRMLRSAVQL